MTLTAIKQQGDNAIVVDQNGSQFSVVNKMAHGAAGTTTLVEASAPLPTAEQNTLNVIVVSSTPPAAKRKVTQYLSANGDGTGATNANLDFSSGTGTPDIFYIQPPASTLYRIHRMIVSIQDTSGFSAAEYGNLSAALGVGIQVRVEDDSGTLDNLTGGIKVTTNAGWSQKCYDADVKSWSTGDEFLVVRWSFNRFGDGILLDGDSNERIEVTLDDDMTGLVAHYFFMNGEIE